jgi:DNA-binding response OmpR family regulator
MRKLVMIIDDSRTVRKLLEVTLKREEIKTVCYADGAEALYALKTQPELVPALVFLDVRLPDMDGYAIARLLRSDSRFDTTTIIMLSGYDGIVERLRGRLAGATTYMTKPFKTREILATVSRYLPILAVGEPLSDTGRRGYIHGARLSNSTHR